MDRLNSVFHNNITVYMWRTPDVVPTLPVYTGTCVYSVCEWSRDTCFQVCSYGRGLKLNQSPKACVDREQSPMDVTSKVLEKSRDDYLCSCRRMFLETKVKIQHIFSVHGSIKVEH